MEKRKSRFKLLSCFSSFFFFFYTFHVVEASSKDSAYLVGPFRCWKTSPECGVGGAASQCSDVPVGRDCRGEAFRGIICLQADELEGVNVGLETTHPGQRFEVIFFYGHISTLKTNRWHMTSFYLSQHCQNTSFWHTFAIVRQKLDCHLFNNSYPSQSVCYRPQVRREGKWLRGGNAD